MKVLVVDDHELVRRGICSVLATEPRLTICGEAIDGKDAVEKAVKLQPDIVVMDISMPRMNGLEATREIKRLLSEAEIVVVSQHESPEMMRQALKAGARAYVVKSAISNDLLAAIASVTNREPVAKAQPADTNPNLDPEEILERSAAFEKAFLESEKRGESQDAVRQAIAQLQLVTDTMAVAVIRCTRDFRYSWVNSRYAEWIGRSPKEIVGRSIADVLGQEAFESLRPHFEEVLEGQPVSYEEQVTYKNIGHRWVSVAYTPTFDSSGTADGWVATIVDITDRKSQDAELERQSRLLDFSFNAVIMLGAEDRITYWNWGAEELYAWTRDEALGQNIHTLLQTEFPIPLNSITAYLRSEGRWQGELTHIGKNGLRHTVLSRWALIRDPLTHMESIMEINIDTTHTKETEQQLYFLVQSLETRIAERTRELQRANDKLRELSGKLLQTQDEERRRIARELHDGVGQLLAALNMNFSNLLNEKSKLSPKASRSLNENVSLIQQASQEIRTMSHLLHPPLLDEIGLESALHWYVDGFAERSKVTVDLRVIPGFSKDLPRDLALALFRIVQECLTNVHRHSGSLTAVVRIERSPSELTLEVRDKGRGIPPESQAKITSGEGSGVGLRGMRERIRQFGGRLDVRSSSGGTQIVAVLPLPPAVPTGEEVEEEIGDIAQNGDRALQPIILNNSNDGSATVLCIDDEPTGLLLRKLLLESAGHHVIEARSGTEAIRVFQSQKVDAVILDYWMAGMKGTAVASELKRINPAVPIIVLSGVSELPGEAAGIVDQWLVKGSHRAEQLLDSISTLLERRPI